MNKYLAGLAVIALVGGACSSSKSTDPQPTKPNDHRPAATGSGFVDAKWFSGRQNEFLNLATSTPPGNSITDLIAHAERARRDPSYTFDVASVTAAPFASVFHDVDALRDTTDFDMLYFVNLWEGYRDKLSPSLRSAIETHLHSFKYWYDEPTHKGLLDNKWYWSENHRVIYHTLEYLAGAAFPNDTFTNDGTTGASHRDRAKQRILDWINEKVRFGWSEWHSDVYYQKDFDPLLTLAEFAPDQEIAQKATMLLDLLLLDIATHLQKGNFGATHGRSYMKDKSLATDQDTFGLAKLLFVDTNLPYEGGSDPGAVLAARAQKYRLPEVIRRIAISNKTTIDRERMGVKFNPNAPVDLTAPAPYGFDFNDPKNLAFWWERGSQTTWQGVEATLNTLTKYNLWNTEAFSPFIPLRDLVHNNPVEARPLAQRLAPMLALGVLAEVNTYTYREPDVMLSSAQDYRFGMFSQQAHAWQATLDEKAIVFTTHPKNEPRANSQWPDGDGYFTGSGSLPATAQQGPVAINVYNPAFVAPGATGALSSFNYLNYTHAYFPQEYFDEVQQDAHWVFGRKGNGYVGLWSQRIPEWRAAPAGTFTHGLQRPFDLVARGGANNVWIAEVGGAEKYKTFTAFKHALAASSPTVTGGNEIPDPSPITVNYASPGAGLMSFVASHRAPGALSLNGTQTSIADYKRFDNPWITADFQTHTFTISDGTATLSLDFDHERRTARATTG